MLWLHVTLTCDSYFVWAGRESSAYDTQFFLEAVDNPHIKVLKPPEGSNMRVSIC